MQELAEYYGIAQQYLADNTFQEYGVLGLFFNSLLSATAIPLPTEILTSALLIGGESELYVAIALIVGSVIGGLINYSLGYGGNKIVSFFKRKKHLHEKELSDEFSVKTEETNSQTTDEKKSHKVLEKFGWAGIFIASWIPFLGDLMLIGAGSKRMDFKKFMFFMVSGKVFKTVVVVFGLGALFI
jgi:membrane protein YqaA with SNARE-associated domain